MQVKAEKGRPNSALAELMNLQREIAQEGAEDAMMAKLDELAGPAMVEAPTEVYQMLQSGELRLGPKARRATSEEKSARRRGDGGDSDDEGTRRQAAAEGYHAMRGASHKGEAPRSIRRMAFHSNAIGAKLSGMEAETPT